MVQQTASYLAVSIKHHWGDAPLADPPRQNDGGDRRDRSRGKDERREIIESADKDEVAFYLEGGRDDRVGMTRKRSTRQRRTRI
jgi:hypothetical protein